MDPSEYAPMARRLNQQEFKAHVPATAGLQPLKDFM
jgi:hypothetical protein